jgi:hypothetical protein
MMSGKKALLLKSKQKSLNNAQPATSDPSF